MLVLLGAPPALAASISATEGQQFSDIVDSTTCSTTAPSSVTIDWGDGTTSAGTYDSSTGVSGTHTYAAAGTYTGSVTYNGGSGCPSSPDPLTASVQDAQLSAAGVMNAAATQGQPFTGAVATFTDADTGANACDFMATIDWGDSTSNSTVNCTNGITAQPGGGFAVSGNHTYTPSTPGNEFVSVTINDVKPQGGTGGQSLNEAFASTTVAVGQAPPAFTQCPPVFADQGCQFVIVITGSGQTILQDPYQHPYETNDDALIGVVNKSNRPLEALPLSATGSLFGFETGSGSDGLCNPLLPKQSGPVPSGCKPAPHSRAGTKCGPQGGTCSFPPPPGQPIGYHEPGAPTNNTQNGYEGPTTWFSNVNATGTRGHVNFSPPLQPGQSTYFSLEEPPTSAGGQTTLKSGKPTGHPPLPHPVVGKILNATPGRGVVLVKVPGQGFIPLAEARQLPVGAVVDALGGTFTINTAAAKGRGIQTGTFSGAVVKITQLASGADKSLTTLQLLEGVVKGGPSFALCNLKAADRPSASAARLSSRILQTLHANVHGHFRTRGRFAAATVRGTQWLMEDRCDGTWTHVQRGSVTVQDLVHHRTVIVKRNQTYLARAR